MGGMPSPAAAAAIAEALKPAGRKALVLALRHKEAAEAAKAAAATELQLRRELLDLVFPALELGAQRRELAEGYQLRAEVSPRPKFDERALRELCERMLEDGLLGAELAARLVRYKPEIRVGELKKLPEKFAGWAAGVVTLEKGLASVELEEPAQ